jgi:hypothetical protein
LHKDVTYCWSLNRVATTILNVVSYGLHFQ